MNTKQALDALIAYALCGVDEEKTDLHCTDCPRYKPTEDEENFDNCESWTPKEVAEAIRLLKNVEVLDPNPDIPGKWVLAKMLQINTEPEIITPVNDIKLIDNLPIHINT